MERCIIRQAQLEDLPGIAGVNLSAFGSPSHPYSLRQNFDLFAETYLVAEAGERIVGFCLAATQPRTDKGWILDLAVHSEYQIQGIGKSLMREVCHLLTKKGTRILYLTVNPEKPYLIKFYENFGFEVEREEKEYFGAGHDRLIMRASI